MGVDFDQRNEMMDEYLKALRASLTGEEFSFEGTGFTAFGNRIVPGPVQARLPIHCGGNSRRAIRRVVELCDGWNPFFTASGINTAATRTLPMEGPEDLAAGIAYMRECCDKTGRADLPEVVLGGVNSPGEELSHQQIVDRLGVYAEMGVTTAAVTVKGRTRAEWCDNAEKVGAEVIAKIG